MRTFSEYINEARQNYIFGGTDDRNTNVTYSKKICELEQGDTLYWCNLDNNGRIKSTDNVDICKFISLEILKSKNYKLDFSYLINGKKAFGNTIVDKRNLDSTVNEYYNSHISYTIIGTDLDDLLDKLKDYVKVESDVEAARKFFKKKEEELGKANEALQNYIFGGTDNRNSDIDYAKTFSELKEGDTIYWCHSEEPYRLTIKKTFRVNNEVHFKCEGGFYPCVPIDECDNRLYVLKHDGLCIDIVCTDRDLFVETLNEECGLRYTVDDIKDETV